MKRKTFIILVISVLCTLVHVEARIAPTMSAAVAPESGQTYYLYNVQEGKFVDGNTNSNKLTINRYGSKVVITESGTGYKIQWENSSYYWYSYSNYITTQQGSGTIFTLEVTAYGYTIKCSNGFVGIDGNGLRPDMTEGSIYWNFLPAEDTDYYMAKLKLYDYLQESDNYDFYVNDYEQIYNNPASTTEELDQAQATLRDAIDISRSFSIPSWNEYPILFQNQTSNKFWISSGKFEWYSSDKSVKTLKLTATFNVDEDATLIYKFQNNSCGSCNIFLDGEQVQQFGKGQFTNVRRNYIELSPGKHDVTWECVYDGSNSNGSYYFYLYDIGIQKTPTLYSTTTLESQLGTEVLKQTDHVANVKKIVVNGVIGADDWTTLGMMVNAFDIDLSGATTTAPIPDSWFTGSKFPFLHSFKLPQGLTAIGQSAFKDSDIENEMTFPSTMQTIGSNAFRGTKLKGAYMSEGITSVGEDTFENCYYLEQATWPSTATAIPKNCFENCNNLQTFIIPEGVKTIGDYAFYNCSKFNVRFPSSIKNVYSNAFFNTATDSLFINENVEVQYQAFSNCRNLVYAEWPTSFSYISSSGNTIGTSKVVSECPKLNKVKLKSPTVVSYYDLYFLSGNTLGNITLLVPDFLVTAYKLDPYWYQCKVEGFSSEDISDWSVTRPLILNAGQRIGGMPSLHFSGSEASFVVNGDETQIIKDLSINYCSKTCYINSYNYYIDQQWGMMLGNNNNVNITGELSEIVITAEKTWYFLTLPFDTKVSDIAATSIETGAATSFAVRYYDGAARAANGSGGNWKNYSASDVIPAGTGFIFQTAKAARSKFVAQNNATKQQVLSNKEIKKSLNAYPSDAKANKGWNLVGNPWQTFYNIHKLNFIAPITVWDLSNKKYVAYSIIDDDYAIKPLEAFFVQCPDELNEITFPIDGRQLTSVIEDQNGARATASSNRQLIDVVLTAEGSDYDDMALSDRTRFVLNPQASLDYETYCDASKFFSMDATVPQLYTLEEGERLAINERPQGDGSVQLGMMLAADGTYTLSAPRCQFASITLIDHETGAETDLATTSYTFSAAKGTHEGRFELSLSDAELNGIRYVSSPTNSADQTFDLQGRRVQQPQKGFYIINGKKMIRK